MDGKTKKINSYSEAKDFLDFYGDFHDCIIECLVQNFAEKRLEMHIDNLFSGLESNKSQPGAIIFEQIEYLACQIPYVGGEVRIEGVEVFEAEDGFKLEFDLTTTEWMDSEEFKTIKTGVEARQMSVREHLD
jgi:hypothetical protein